MTETEQTKLDLNNLIKPKKKPKKRAPSKQFNWRELPIDEWNSTTFRTYLDHLNMTKFGIGTLEHVLAKTRVDAITRITNISLKQTFEKYGKAETKRFLELAVEKYKGSIDYPTATFPFILRFNLDSLMPKAIKEVQQDLAGETTKDNSAYLKGLAELF